jgi:hypothetical protein
LIASNIEPSPIDRLTPLPLNQSHGPFGDHLWIACHSRALHNQIACRVVIEIDIVKSEIGDNNFARDTARFTSDEINPNAA